MEEPIKIKFEMVEDDFLRPADRPSPGGKRKSQQIKVVTKHFKQTVTTYQYLDHGQLAFSSPQETATSEVGAPEESVTEQFPCADVEFYEAQVAVLKSYAPPDRVGENTADDSVGAKIAGRWPLRSRVSPKKSKKAKTEVLDPVELDDYREDPAVVFQIGRSAFHRGEIVFAVWDFDGKWYTGRVGGTRLSTFRVQWCENREVSYVDPDEVLSLADMLQPGLHVSVLEEDPVNRVYYKDMLVIEYRPSGRHLMLQTKIKDQIELIRRKYRCMAVLPEELQRWRDSRCVTGRARSPSPELGVPAVKSRGSSEECLDFNTRARTLLQMIADEEKNVRVKEVEVKSAPKARDVLELPEAEDWLDTYLHEDFSVQFPVGTRAFHQGERVFASWSENLRWLFGRVTGMSQWKVGVRWFGKAQVNYISPERVISAKDIMDSCIRMFILSKNKRRFKPVTLRTSVMECLTGNLMMIENADMKQWMEANSDLPVVTEMQALQSGRTEPALPNGIKTEPCDDGVEQVVRKRLIRRDAYSLPEPEDFLRDHLFDSRSVQFQLGQHVFHRGEKVFATWPDSLCWYFGQVSGIVDSKFGVLWYGTAQINFICPDNVIRARDIIKPGIRIFVMPINKPYFKKLKFNDRFLNEPVEQIMIEAEEVRHMQVLQHWRRTNQPVQTPSLPPTQPSTVKMEDFPTNLAPPDLPCLPSISLFRGLKKPLPNGAGNSRPFSGSGQTSSDSGIEDGRDDEDGMENLEGNRQLPAEVSVKVEEPFSLSESGLWGRKKTLEDVLAISTIAAVIARHLPMRSLNAFCQVNQLSSAMGGKEKLKPRRQHIYVVMQMAVLLALERASSRRQHLFANVLSSVYCQPQLIVAFCSAFTMTPPLYGAIRDLLPPGSSNILHIMTDAVLSPFSVSTGQICIGYHVKEADLSLLFIPRIDGVTIYRKYKAWTVDDLRVKFPEAVWLGPLDLRPESDFILPVMKDLRSLSPKLIILFTKWRTKYSHVTLATCPVIILPTPWSEFALDALIFRGNLVAFQIHIEPTAEPAVRWAKIRHLRSQFTTLQVSGSRMLLLYFRNGLVEPLERDVMCLRVEFPNVPVFGGVYSGVAGSVFTGDRQAADFGGCFGALQSVIVCGVVLGSSGNAV